MSRFWVTVLEYTKTERCIQNIMHNEIKYILAINYHTVLQQSQKWKLKWILCIFPQMAAVDALGWKDALTDRNTIKAETNKSRNVWHPETECIMTTWFQFSTADTQGDLLYSHYLQKSVFDIKKTNRVNQWFISSRITRISSNDIQTFKSCVFYKLLQRSLSIRSGCR